MTTKQRSQSVPKSTIRLSSSSHHHHPPPPSSPTSSSTLDMKKVESQKMDLLTLGIDIDPAVIARMQLNLASKVANILKKKHPDIYQYPIVTYRYNENNDTTTTKLSTNITQETKRALMILRELSIQQDNSNTNTTTTTNRDIITKTLAIYKDIYIQSPDKFINHILTNNTSNITTNNTSNTTTRLLTKNTVMSEHELIRILLKLAPSVPRYNIKKVLDLFQEHTTTTSSGDRMINVSIFIALLRMSIKKDNDTRRSNDDVAVRFWTKENIRGSPVKGGRATGSLTKGSRWANVGGNNNNDDDTINDDDGIAPFLKYWHEIDTDNKLKHTKHMNFERDPSIHSSSSIEILGQGHSIDIIPSRVAGTLTKRELVIEDVDMDNILKESTTTKKTQTEVKKRVGFHVDAHGKSTKSMLMNNNNSSNQENDDRIIFLAPSHPKSPTKKASSDFIRLREGTGICRKANCTCGSHAISTLTEGAGLPRYNPLNVESTKPESKEFDEILSPHKCAKGEPIKNDRNIDASFLSIPMSQVSLKSDSSHSIRSSKGCESQSKVNNVSIANILNLGTKYSADEMPQKTESIRSIRGGYNRYKNDIIPTPRESVNVLSFSGEWVPPPPPSSSSSSSSLPTVPE